jgi:hypothetical protein
MGLIINKVTHRYWRQACRKAHSEYTDAKKKYSTPRSLIKKTFGYCPCCEKYFRLGVKTKRRNTSYVEESENWLTACKECHSKDEAYFADLLEQYYNSI